MSEWKEIVKVTESTRLVVTYDYWTENPLEWTGDEFAVVSISGGYYRQELVTEGTLADSRIRDIRYWAENDDTFYSAVMKHFERRGCQVIEREWRGYSQGDYKRYILAIDPEYGEVGPRFIQGAAENYESWLSGDVYCVQLQRAERYVRMAEDGTIDPEDTIFEWEHVDSISGCYLDRDYTAASVALEYFDLTNAEASALKG